MKSFCFDDLLKFRKFIEGSNLMKFEFDFALKVPKPKTNLS